MKKQTKQRISRNIRSKKKGSIVYAKAVHGYKQLMSKRLVEQVTLVSGDRVKRVE